MKKLVSVALLFIFSNSLLAQSKQPNIQFDTEYFQAVDHWVVVPEVGTASEYLLGYIYIDEVTGFTFTEFFPIDIPQQGKWVKKLSHEIVLKRHLDKSTPLVLLVSPKKIREQKLPVKPEWLKTPLPVENQALVRGFHFNSIGKSAMAIPFLESAYRKNSDDAAFELAYAYNATDQFEKAVNLLREVLKHKKEVVLFRELGYALIRKGKFEQAETAYEAGINISNDNFQKAKMATDMAQHFYQLKDIIKFEKWSARSREFSQKDTPSLKTEDAPGIKNGK